MSGDTARAISEENVEVCKRALKLFERLDVESGLDHVDPEVVFQSAIVSGAEGKTFRGYDGLRQWAAESNAAFDDLQTVPGREARHSTPGAHLLPFAWKAQHLRDTARAMSQENVDAYERAVEASNRQDLDAMLEEFDPEVEWYPAVVGMGSEVYRGADGIRELFEDMGETIPDAFFEVSEIRDLGDRLLSFGRLHAHGRQSSAPTEVPFAQLVHFKDSKATVLRTFLNPKEALEAAGLSE